MPVCKKVNSGVAPPRSTSQSEASHELQWKICTLRLWLDKIMASAISQEKVAINVIERKRFFYLRREIDHCNDLVSKLCLLTDRPSTVLRSLYNIHRIVHKVARILSVSQHLPPPVVMQGRFLPPPGKLRRFLSRVYKRCSLTRRNATIQNEEEMKSNNHEALLAIIREKRAPEKPNRMLLYSHRDISARLKYSHGSQIHTKSLLNACQLSDVQEDEDELLEQNDRSTCSFGPCTSTELVLSEQRSSHELLAVKESSCELDAASEEVIFKLETVADTSSGGNIAGESSGPDPRPVRSPRATLPPLQISSRSTVSSGTVSRHLGSDCHELDALGSTSSLPPLRVSPVLAPLKVSPRSTAKQSIVKTSSDNPKREADSKPVRSPIRVTPQCSSHDLLTVEITCGNDTASDTVMSQLEITPANTTPDCQDTVSAETGPKPVRSPRRTALPPLKISPRSTGKRSIPAVIEVETDIASKLETLVRLGSLYALPPIKASNSFTNDGNDTTSDPISPDAQSENALEKSDDGSMAASPSDDLSSQMSPSHICHSSGHLDTPKKSIFVRAWSRLRNFFCIKKVAPL